MSDCAVWDDLVHPCLAAPLSLHRILTVGLILMALEFPFALQAVVVVIVAMCPSAETILVVLNFVRWHMFTCCYMDADLGSVVIVVSILVSFMSEQSAVRVR